jgi:hypothetical protein
MFNLLVSADSSAWEGKGRFSMPVDRFKEYSGDEAASLNVANPESLKVLERVPSILMYELGTEGNTAENAYFGELRDIQHSGSS